MTISPVPCPDASQLLRSAGACIDPADAALLLAHALRRPQAWLYAHATEPVAAAAAAEFEALVARRAAGEPVAYLIGHRGFWTLDLAVTPDTLIPRPETELLVEQALLRIPPGSPACVADLGTGSGAIALAVASERPLARVVATDVSRQALAAAAANADTHGIGNVEFRHGDWWSPLAGERFELIASNPPYIADADPHLLQGDLRFEPRRALASGRDGLDAIDAIVGGAPAHLVPGGWLLFEHGHTQGEAVRRRLLHAGFAAVATECDLEGRERVTAGRSPGPAGAD